MYSVINITWKVSEQNIINKTVNIIKFMYVLLAYRYVYRSNTDEIWLYSDALIG